MPNRPVYRLKSPLAALLITILFFTTSSAWAEEVRYVTDELQVTVRNIPSSDSKVLFLVKSGMKLILLDSNGEGLGQNTG